MPIRLPRAEAVRRAIADKAAASTGGDIDHFLDLLGPVEPAVIAVDGADAPWRLAYYLGSPIENQAIERAVGAVQRQSPLISLE